MNLENLFMKNCKNLDEYRFKYYQLKKQIKNHEIIIENQLKIKMLNNLSLAYKSYMTILHDKMRNVTDDKSLIEEAIFKTLEEKEIKMNVDRKARFNVARTDNNEGNREGNNDGKSLFRSICKKCDRIHLSEQSCHDVDQKCDKCSVKNHTERNHDAWKKVNEKKNKKNKNKKNKNKKKNKNVDNSNINNVTCFAITTATSHSDLVIDLHCEVESCVNREDMTSFIVFNASTLSIPEILTSSNEKIPLDNHFNFSSSSTMHFTNVSRLHESNALTSSLVELILNFDIFAHLIINKDLIQNYYEDFEQYQTRFDETLSSFGKEILFISLDHDTLTLLNVLYASNLRYNLISTMLLDRKSVETYLRISDLVFQLLYKDNVLRYANFTNEQYVVRIKFIFVTNVTKIERRSEQSTKTRFIDFDIWHERMTHLKYQNLQKLKETTIEVEFQDIISDEICESCMTERQHRCISRISDEVCIEFLEEIHNDIVESYSSTRQSHRYYQFFYDEAKELFDIYLIKYKSEFLQNFKKYTTLRENQSDCRLKIIHIDDVFLDWDDFCKEKRIIHKISSLYIFEQNDKAKRFNRIVMSFVRSILYKKKLAKSCWDEITKTVVYLLNRSFLEKNFKFAFERLQNKKSYIEHLKILECRAWIHILKKKRFKVDERTWQDILVDYDAINQYRILDSRIEKIHVTRDVSFDENNIYDRKELRLVDCDDEKWAFNNDELFIDLANLIVASDNSDDDENSWYRFVSRSNFRVSRNQYATSSNTFSMRADDDNSDIDDDDDSLLEDLKSMEYARSSETHRFRQQNQEEQVFDDVDVDVDEDDDIISLRNVNTSSRRFRKKKSIFTSESSLLRRFERNNADQFNKSKNYYYSESDEQTYLKVNEEEDFVRSKSDLKANFMRKFMYAKTISKSHIHMIIALAMLIVDADTVDIDESLILKQAKVSSHWLEFQKIMKREFDSLIENETWDLTFASFSQSILIDRWVFKIKKDRWDNILKFKTR